MSPVPPKKKLTPAQRFALIFTQWTRGAIPEDRANGERHADACLKRMGKTRADIPELLVQAHADDKAANPPPPPSDPRVDESVRYDPKRHSVANLVEGLLKTYVTMSEHVRTIY